MNKRAYHIPPSSAECRQCKSYRPDIGCSEISCIQLKSAINDGTVTYRDLLMTIYPQPPTLGWKIQELAGTYLCKLWHDANHHARFHFLCVSCQPPRITDDRSQRSDRIAEHFLHDQESVIPKSCCKSSPFVIYSLHSISLGGCP